MRSLAQKCNTKVVADYYMPKHSTAKLRKGFRSICVLCKLLIDILIDIFIARQPTIAIASSLASYYHKLEMNWPRIDSISIFVLPSLMNYSLEVLVASKIVTNRFDLFWWQEFVLFNAEIGSCIIRGRYLFTFASFQINRRH